MFASHVPFTCVAVDTDGCAGQPNGHNEMLGGPGHGGVLRRNLQAARGPGLRCGADRGHRTGEIRRSRGGARPPRCARFPWPRKKNVNQMGDAAVRCLAVWGTGACRRSPVARGRVGSKYEEDCAVHLARRHCRTPCGDCCRWQKSRGPWSREHVTLHATAYSSHRAFVIPVR